MNSKQTETFLVFKEAAGESLGLGDDEFELIALDKILARMEDLYSRDVSRFELIVEAIQRDEVYWIELESGIEKFRERLIEHFGIREPKLRALQFAPIEEPVFKGNVNSEGQLRFFQRFGSEYNFNRMRGGYLLDFMLARFVEENERFKSLSIGMRSRLVAYSGNLESAYSIWESNNLGRVWSLPSAALPRSAYPSATYRLIDGLCSAADFDATYQIFKSHLNPLVRFPVQLLYNVIMSDPKTVVQEFGQANLAAPVYQTSREAGPDHDPEFRCKLSLGKMNCEGVGNSKKVAEVAAARGVVELLVQNEKKKMLEFIENAIGKPTLRRDRKSRGLNNSIPGLKAFQLAVGTACSDLSLAKAITVKADTLAQSSETNEQWAFCGSNLALAIAAEKALDKARSSISARKEICTAIQEARRILFPSSKVKLSSARYMDVIQAVLYAEFLQNGYVSVRNVFDRCIVSFSASEHSVSLEQFQSSVPYTKLLQERTQEAGIDLPSFSYVLTNPTQVHRPVFRCTGVYREFRAEALGESKKAARQKACYELLKILNEQ